MQNHIRSRTYKMENSSIARSKSKRSPTVVSNYEIRQTIGSGGYGKVKRAVHMTTGVEVAVKIYSLNKLSQKQLDKFELEIQISKKLVHQNIAKIYEIYRDSNKMYIFMEYCQGGELFEYLRKYGALSKKTGTRIFKQIYNAIKYMHTQGICHRDIKAENILLDDNFNAKLIDFGLSVFYQTNSEQSQATLKTYCGSPSYLSPEMISKTPYLPQKLDVWCLGVLLYVIIKGQLPFYDDDPIKQKKNIMMIKFRPTSDDECDALLERMLCNQKNRISLQQIQYSDLFLSSPSCSANYLVEQEQKQAIDFCILDKIQRQLQISSFSILSSLQQGELNQFYALYYIYLQKQRKLGNASYYDINSPDFMSKKNKFFLRQNTRSNSRKKVTSLSTKSSKESLGKAFFRPLRKKGKINIDDDLLMRMKEEISHLTLNSSYNNSGLGTYQRFPLKKKVYT